MDLRPNFTRNISNKEEEEESGPKFECKYYKDYPSKKRGVLTKYVKENIRGNILQNRYGKSSKKYGLLRSV